jgi:hypothetical protein
MFINEWGLAILLQSDPKVSCKFCFVLWSSSLEIWEFHWTKWGFFLANSRYHSQKWVPMWPHYCSYFVGLAYQGKVFVFGFIIEYSNLRDFGPKLIIIVLFLYEDFWKAIFWLVLKLEISYRVINRDIRKVRKRQHQDPEFGHIHRVRFIF